MPRCSAAVLLALSLALMLAYEARGQGLFQGGFERDVNRYRWTGEVDLESSVGPWRFALMNAFRSDAFILFDDRLTFRDENHARLTLERPIGGGTLSLYGSNGWYSLSRVFSQDVLAGFRFPVASGVWVEPVVGASLDSRPGFAEGAVEAPLRADAGPAAGIRLSIPSRLVDEYQVQVSGEALVQSLGPRRGDFFRAMGQARRTFENTRVGTVVHAASVRRDAYQAASFLNRDDAALRVEQTVESTRSDTLAAAVTVDVPVAGATVVSGRVDFSANRRMVETLRAPESAIFFDSEFSRRVVEAEFSSTYARGSSFLRFSIRAGAEVERRVLTNADDLPAAQASQKLNLLRQADYDRGLLLAHTTARLPFGGAMLMADFSASILRHDTPEVNPDDRDELYYNGLLGIATRPSRFLEFQIQAFGTYFHTVYLKAARSAENNVQRSLRLRPSVVWRPATGTRIDLATEVRANYSVDDFVLPGRRPSDQSARELSYNLEAEHELADGLRVKVSGRISDLRLGRFLDNAFAEIPFDTLRTTSAWVRLSAGERVQAEVGLRVFIRSDFDRSTTVSYPRADDPAQLQSISRPGRRRITQLGPTASVLWPFDGGALLRMDGWATVQTVSNTLYGELPEGLEDVIRRAARRGTRTLIPNLAVSMQWRF